MKMTMEIDEPMLKGIMRHFGYRTKTEAVAAAITDMDRKKRYAEFNTSDWGWTPEKIGDLIDPNYDVLKMREDGVTEHCRLWGIKRPSLKTTRTRAAGKSARYGKKRSR